MTEPGRGLRHVRPRLRDGRQRHGDGVRPGCQRGARLRAARARPARPRARPTRSARSAACSAWPCSPRVFTGAGGFSHAAGLRRRADSGRLGRRGGAGGRARWWRCWCPARSGRPRSRPRRRRPDRSGGGFQHHDWDPPPVGAALVGGEAVVVVDGLGPQPRALVPLGLARDVVAGQAARGRESAPAGWP